jgi:hypothetical protein
MILIASNATLLNPINEPFLIDFSSKNILKSSLQSIQNQIISPKISTGGGGFGLKMFEEDLMFEDLAPGNGQVRKEETAANLRSRGLKRNLAVALPSDGFVSDGVVVLFARFLEDSLKLQRGDIRAMKTNHAGVWKQDTSLLSGLPVRQYEFWSKKNIKDDLKTLSESPNFHGQLSKYAKNIADIMIEKSANPINKVILSACISALFSQILGPVKVPIPSF